MGLSTMMQGALGAVGTGMAEIGAKEILAQQQAEIEALRDARLSEMRLTEEQTIADRKVERDATERTRIEGEAQGMADAESSGFINSARSQYQNSTLSDEDKAAGLAAVDAAESGGAYKRAPTNAERLQAKGDYKGAEDVKNLERDNARLDSTFAAETEHRSKTLQETIRHNKEMESRAGEKLSPAARAQLEMASSSLTSAHKAEAEAFTALIAIQKDRAALPADVESAKRAYDASKKWTQDVHVRNNELGKALFGDEWKVLETPAAGAPPPAAGGKLVYGADGKLVRDKPAAPAAGDKPAAPAAGGNEIQKIDAEIATIRTSLNTDKTRRTNPLKGGGEILSADEVSRLEARLSELKTRRQKIGGSPIVDAASGIMNAVRN